MINETTTTKYALIVRVLILVVPKTLEPEFIT